MTGAREGSGVCYVTMSSMALIWSWSNVTSVHDGRLAVKSRKEKSLLHGFGSVLDPPLIFACDKRMQGFQ